MNSFDPKLVQTVFQPARKYGAHSPKASRRASTSVVPTLEPNRECDCRFIHRSRQSTPSDRRSFPGAASVFLGEFPFLCELSSRTA